MSYFIPSLNVESSEATTMLIVGSVRVTLIEITFTIYICPDIKPFETVYWCTVLSSGPDVDNELPLVLHFTS